MSITVKELPGMVGKYLVVEVETPDGDTRHVRGRCTAVSDEGLVLQFRGAVELVPRSEILDIELDERLHRVSLRPSTLITIKQHLLDRHGRPFAYVRDTPVEELLGHHAALTHRGLGHDHQEVSLKERAIPEPVVKTLGSIPRLAVRQHLLDWHGMPFELIKGIDLDLAMITHGSADHSLLGHQHKGE